MKNEGLAYPDRNAAASRAANGARVARICNPPEAIDYHTQVSTSPFNSELTYMNG